MNNEYLDIKMKKSIVTLLLVCLAMGALAVEKPKQGLGFQISWAQPILRINIPQSNPPFAESDKMVIKMNGFKAGIVYDASYIAGFGSTIGLNYTFGAYNSKWKASPGLTEYPMLRQRIIYHQLELFVDWQYKFEIAKETYLMLYDFKGGHKMFMGKDCRLQNETLAHPIQWGGRYPREENMDKAKALEFMQGVKDDKAKALQELETVIAANPNVSDRYINYLKGHYEMDECRILMQVRYYMKDRKIPAEIMDYVNQHWQQLRRPYTLYRDFGTFRRNYIDNLIADRYISEGGIVRTPLLYPVILRKYRDKGKVKITDEELDIVQRYAEGFCKYSCYMTEDEEAKKAHDAFFE